MSDCDCGLVDCPHVHRRIADLEKQLAERDAAIAAMREALEVVADWIDHPDHHEDECPGDCEGHASQWMVNRALRADAGRDFEARIRADEREKTRETYHSSAWETLAWNEAVEACRQFILGGHFLHDESPAKRFAHEVVAALRRVKRGGA